MPKLIVYNFLTKELSTVAPSTADSILFERYSRANTVIGGLDCICELNFPWTNSPIWVCTVCNVAKKSLESADVHLYNITHRRNYIKVHHPQLYNEMMQAQKKAPTEEHSNIEYIAIQKLLYEGKCLAPPDVYVLDDRGRNWAHKRLGLADSDDPVSYILEPISDQHQIVQCRICGETFFAYENEQLLRQSWNAHLSSTNHQRRQMLLTVLEEGDLQVVPGIPKFCRDKAETTFEIINDAFYGPTCGYEFLVDFKDDNECFCTLCFCILKRNDATDHFASEFHIQKFTRYHNPSRLLNVEFLTSGERHNILSEVIQKTEKLERHGACKGKIPLLLRRFASANQHKFTEKFIEEIMIASQKTVWCKECTLCIKIVEKESWMDHIFSDDHFDFCTKRALYYIDAEGLVPNSATLPTFRVASKGWADKFSVAMGRSLSVQDHCYYGSEYIVRDELGRYNICLSCHFVCSYEDDEAISIHVRSFEHLFRIIHLTNKRFLALLWKIPQLDKQKALMLDYLKHRKINAQIESPIVYDPVGALNANCYGSVSKLLLEISKLPPESRESSLGLLRANELNNEEVPLNIAMRSTSVEIRFIESVIVMFCQECRQSFACSLEKVSHQFAEHLFSPSHWNRCQIFRDNQLDENKRIIGQTSSFDVTPFVQSEKKKKVTWRWNETWKCFEYVYAQLGLSDICERRNFKAKRDLFCTLCGETFKAAKYELEHHIRSFSHVFYYVHNHNPAVVPDLENLLLEKTTDLLKHKNIRNLFSKSLKHLENANGEISIYDMSLKFCESQNVKKAIELEDHDKVTPIEFIMKNIDCYSNAIYSNYFVQKSSAELHQLLVYMVNSSPIRKGGKEVSLEDAKLHLLGVVLNEDALMRSVQNEKGNDSCLNVGSDVEEVSVSMRNNATGGGGDNKNSAPKEGHNTTKSSQKSVRDQILSPTSSTTKRSGNHDHRSSPSIKRRRSVTPTRDQLRSCLHSSKASTSHERLSSRSDSKVSKKPAINSEKIKEQLLNRLHQQKGPSKSETKEACSNEESSAKRMEKQRESTSRWNSDGSSKPKEATFDSATNPPMVFDVAHAKAVEEFLAKTDKSVPNPVVPHLSAPLTGVQISSNFHPIIPTHPLEFRPPLMNPLGFIPMRANLFVPGSLPPQPSFFPVRVPSVPPPFIVPQQQPVPSVVDQTELVMRAKMELYQRDLIYLSTIAELIEYMWKQGYDEIAPSEPPLVFNEVVKKRRGILGCSTLYQIICYGRSELETYYCGMCNHWTTVSEMFLHLGASMHRLNYMFRNYKMYHKKAMSEPDENIRDVMLQEFAELIWKLEGSGKCTHRMRCILNEEAIRRLWPEYISCIDNSWKIIDTSMELGTSSLSTNTLNKNNLTSISKSNGNKQLKNAPDIRALVSGLDGIEESAIEKINEILRKHRSDNYVGSSDGSETSRQSPRNEWNRKEGRKEREKSPKKKSERSRSRSCRREFSTSSSRRTDKSRERLKRNETDSKRSKHSQSKERIIGQNSRYGHSSAIEESKKKLDSWDARAAAFLDRIGNRREASKIYLNALVSTDVSESDASRSDDSAVNKTLNGAMNAAKSFGSQQQKSRNKPVDEKADMRKTIAVIVELQSIFEKENVITKNTVFKVAEDMGISAEAAIENTLLRDSALLYGVDLKAEYDSWLAENFVKRSIQGTRSKNQKQNSSGLEGLSSEVMDILKKANFKLNNVNQPGQPVLNEEISYIYPSYDEPQRSQRSSNEIEATINNLTYAFSNKRSGSSNYQSVQQPHSRLNHKTRNSSNNLEHCGQDFQRFSDEDDDDYDDDYENDYDDDDDDDYELQKNMEQHRQILQDLAECRGLCPEVAAAAAAAAMAQQGITSIKKNPNSNPSTSNCGISKPRISNNKLTAVKPNTPLKSNKFPLQQQPKLPPKYPQRGSDSFDVMRAVQEITRPNTSTSTTFGFFNNPAEQTISRLKPPSHFSNDSPLTFFGIDSNLGAPRPKRPPRIHQYSEDFSVFPAQNSFRPPDLMIKSRNSNENERQKDGPENNSKPFVPSSSSALQNPSEGVSMDNLVNMASKIGDDWGSLNCLTSFLKKTSTAPKTSSNDPN